MKNINYKYFSIFAAIYSVALISTLALNSKFIAIGGWYIVGGALTFPITFIINDILTEVYGFRESRKIIWTALFLYCGVAGLHWFVGTLPAPSFWTNQAAFDLILGISPRIALGGICAYISGEFVNSFIISKMKFVESIKTSKFSTNWLKSKRFVISTIFGELVDSVVFASIALSFALDLKQIVVVSMTIWIVKVLFEVVLLPFTLPFVDWVKKQESLDTVDQWKLINN